MHEPRQVAELFWRGKKFEEQDRQLLVEFRQSEQFVEQVAVQEVKEVQLAQPWAHTRHYEEVESKKVPEGQVVVVLGKQTLLNTETFIVAVLDPSPIALYPSEHLVQLVAVHVSQLAGHFIHLVLFIYVPVGQLATH